MGFPENQHAAHAGGTVAGNARRELEKKSGRKVVISGNYLALIQKRNHWPSPLHKRNRQAPDFSPSAWPDFRL